MWKMAIVENKKVIGIPNTLNVYMDIFNWPQFLELLNFEVVYSPNSKMNIFNEGFKKASSDQCFPIKLYYGHVIELTKSKVDYIFIPQLISLKESTYSCPAIIGLPTLIKNTVENLPELIQVNINLNDINTTILNVFKVSIKLSNNPIRISAAMKYFITRLHQVLKNEHLKKKSIKNNNKKIAILGHKYALNDNLLNMNILNKIKDYGYEYVTIEEIEHEISKIKEIDKPFGYKKVHWDFGQKIISGADYFLKDKNISGIIFLTFFGCGIDAFIEEVFKKEVSNKKPYLCLTIDEQTGEAGLVTRIEAFLDMIKREV